MRRRLGLVSPLLPPLLALAIQWVLWPWLAPFAWLLFYPAVFFSARLGGFPGGVASTLLSTVLVGFFFLPPGSWTLDTPADGLSLGIFLLTGVLFSSAQARMGTARRSAETRFQATFHQAGVGIALVAPDGRFLRVNRKFCEIAGFREDELLARRFQDITHPDDLAADQDQVAHMLARQIDSYSMEKRYIRKDGAPVWIRLTVSLVSGQDGSPDHFIAVAEDIQVRKAAEAALAESESVLRQAQGLARLGSWTWDLRSNVRIWSEGMYRIFGRDPAMPIVGVEEILAQFSPESRERLTAAVEKARQEGVSYEEDGEIHLPDGRCRWVVSRGEALRDASGAVVLLRGMTQDITERKRVEAALRESEERLRVFIEHAPAALAMFDREMRYLAVSRRWLADYGLGEPEMLIGRSHYEAFPSVPEGWKAAHDRGMAGEVVRLDEDPFERLDGQVQWLRWEVRPWRSADGAVGGIVVFTEDITERKQTALALQRHQSATLEEQHQAWLAALNLMEDAEAARTRAESANAALRASEARLAEVQQIAHIGGWELDERTKDLWLSEESYRIFELDPDVAKPYEVLMDRIHPDDREWVVRAYRQSLIAGTALDFTFRLVTQGRVKFVHSRLEPRDASGEESKHLVGTVQDVTDKMAVEHQLKKLAQVVEQSPESVVITDREGRIEYVNEAFVTSSGYRREEVIGHNPRILASGRTPPRVYANLRKTLGRGESWKGEFFNRRKDGSEFIAFAIINPLRQADGAISHYVGVQEDVTEKKHLGEELDQYRHHLEELVAARTTELQQAQIAAESANRAKSTFLANMSHEIRTPMNAILGLTHLLRRDGAATPLQSERLDKIEGAARHLLSIINDVLDLSKIEADKVVLESQDFSLASVLDHVHSLIGEAARAKGLEVEVDGDHVPVWLRGDPTRLRQALLNYGGNAVKFTERGRITLRANLLEDQGERLKVRFEVRDTGIGIDPDTLSGLFQAFEQADRSTTRKYGGTGLGLAITRRLAGLMGGEAGAESVVGQGSTFWFTAWLGRGAPQQAAQAPASATEALLRVRCSGARLLLVEDNAINREVALEMLSGLGLRVETAENGREAVDKIQASSYDLVLMDMQMPVLDGLAATREVRALPGRQGLPILAMTANAFGEDRAACLAAGMNDFVPKPTEAEVLYATLCKWLPEREVSRPGRSEPPPPGGGGAAGVGVEAALARLARLPGMDVDRGLRVLRGKKERYVALLRQFALGHRDDMTRLAECLAAGDSKGALLIAHTIKGAAGNAGMASLTEGAQALEHALREVAGGQEPGCLTPLMDRVAGSLAALLAALEEEAPPPRPALPLQDPARQRVVLAELGQLVEQCDLRAEALCRDEAPLLRAALGERFDALRGALQRFDFDSAQAIVLTLAPVESASPEPLRPGGEIDS
ncbi:MAG: PAS domain S-box protein [Rhodocyclaceae bacterium]|jgi:PAS domain S-box-containing protein|nr:PAS domain S-box protein [Rhodocyclaceae bacterium]